MFSLPAASPAALLLLSAGAAAAATLAGPSSDWTVVPHINPANSDPASDQQTGVRDGDIVGNATHAAFYTTFNNGGTPGILNDGQIGFRLRVAGDQNPSGFASAFWVGIDANRDGTIDLFAGAIEGSRVGFYPAGNQANISPSTTSIDSTNFYYQETGAGSNYLFTPVTAALDPSATNFNLDAGSSGGGDHIDHYVTFMLPFGELVTAVTQLGIGSFDETTGMQYVVATSNQSNSLNQDLNGLPKTYDGTATWTRLGGFSKVYSANGFAVVPEPSSLLLVATGLTLGWGSRRRNR